MCCPECVCLPARVLVFVCFFFLVSVALCVFCCSVLRSWTCRSIGPSFCSRCAHRRRLVLVAFFLKHFGAVRCRSNWPEAGADVFPFSQAAQMSSILHRSMNQSTSWIHQGMQKNQSIFIYLFICLSSHLCIELSIYLATYLVACLCIFLYKKKYLFIYSSKCINNI